MNPNSASKAVTGNLKAQTPSFCHEESVQVEGSRTEAADFALIPLFSSKIENVALAKADKSQPEVVLRSPSAPRRRFSTKSKLGAKSFRKSLLLRNGQKHLARLNKVSTKALNAPEGKLDAKLR
jgi:hypothetical protein